MLGSMVVSWPSHAMHFGPDKWLPSWLSVILDVLQKILNMKAFIEHQEHKGQSFVCFKLRISLMTLCNKSYVLKIYITLYTLKSFNICFILQSENSLYMYYLCIWMISFLVLWKFRFKKDHFFKTCYYKIDWYYYIKMQSDYFKKKSI